MVYLKRKANTSLAFFDPNKEIIWLQVGIKYTKNVNRLTTQPILYHVTGTQSRPVLAP